MTALTNAVKSTGYMSNIIKVTFELEEEQVVVRPYNWLSTALNTVSDSNNVSS